MWGENFLLHQSNDDGFISIGISNLIGATFFLFFLFFIFSVVNLSKQTVFLCHFSHLVVFTGW